MWKRHPGRTATGAALGLALLAGLAPALPARGAGPADEGAASPAPIVAAAVPGLDDLIAGRAVFFTRRLAPSGETVAFSFAPTDVTATGRLIGDLGYHGRRASGTVERVLATPALARGGAGGCGRVTLRFEPVMLPEVGGRATLDPVAVDLRRAGPIGRAAYALCAEAGELAAALRELGARLADALPRE